MKQLYLRDEFIDGNVSVAAGDDDARVPEADRHLHPPRREKVWAEGEKEQVRCTNQSPNPFSRQYTCRCNE